MSYESMKHSFQLKFKITKMPSLKFIHKSQTLHNFLFFSYNHRNHIPKFVYTIYMLPSPLKNKIAFLLKLTKKIKIISKQITATMK